MYGRQLSIHYIFHAGRYLDDKEICYLGTVIVTANVCHRLSTHPINTGHISTPNYEHLVLILVYLLYSRSIDPIVIPKVDAKLLTKLLAHMKFKQ